MNLFFREISDGWASEYMSLSNNQGNQDVKQKMCVHFSSPIYENEYEYLWQRLGWRVKKKSRRNYSMMCALNAFDS